jgi:acyl-lipid omega-6 desaturase (Delta-12 desaturase)
MGPAALSPYRHPIVMFGLGPAYLFILKYRLPLGLVGAGWRPWLSTMGTNLAIAILMATVIWFMGVRAFLLVELPITLGASTWVWLFYIQHQFEDTLWVHNESWNRHEVALHGSPHYHLPGILRGTPPIPACTMFITCAAESPTTACLAYSGIIRN